MEATEAARRFEQLVALPDARVPLDEVALCVAAHARPQLDIGAQLARLDHLAAGCPAPTLDGLVRHLFGDLGFRGNVDDYYDPDNSLLDTVLDRRTGLPITLSLLAMEVGRRAGVPLSSVGMPGHFLLRDKVDPTVFVDAFAGGKLLDERACRRIFARLAGPDAPWDPAFLDPLPRLSIVSRLLANLKGVYTTRHDVHGLRWVLRLRVALPDAPAAERTELTRLMAPLN